MCRSAHPIKSLPVDLPDHMEYTRQDIVNLALNDSIGAGVRLKRREEIKVKVFKFRWFITMMLMGNIGNDYGFIKRHLLGRITTLYEENKMLRQQIANLTAINQAKSSRVRRLTRGIQ